MEKESLTGKTRPAAVADRFYPGSEGKLLTEVRNLMKVAKFVKYPGKIPLALIVPHAGYVFSGKVAASAFNQLSANHIPNRVFILASSHQFRFDGASVYCSGNYETPLGMVEVDTETCLQLTRGNKLISCREDVHRDEHSLEVQLPFLQVIYGRKLRLVPVILGVKHPEECSQLAEILRPYFIPGNLFVISSDFSHYPCYDDATTADKATTQSILANSPAYLLKTLEENRKKKIPGLVTSLCGWTSVLTFLYLTEGNPYAFEWIDYQNSGDHPLYGGHDRVVGYSAVAVYENASGDFSLTPGEKEKLLQIAEESIRNKVLTGTRISVDESEWTGRLAENSGAFVSIYISGKLRGCIGHIAGDEPLAGVVNEVAASAAVDLRFDPVSKDELSDISVEISVLSPLKKISSPGEIIPGKHGIYIKKGWSSGTFLPQVAEKYGWSVEEFLGRCARDKAGIGWDGWKTAELFTYEAIIITRKLPLKLKGN